VQTLRAFARLKLSPGQTATAHLQLHWKDFAFYDSDHSDWKVPAGKYQIAVGSSSRNTPATATVRIRE
jgi:beta-glucosidase